jgi:hypothetical protein
VIINLRPATTPHDPAALLGVILSPSTRNHDDNERPPPSPHLRI